MPIFYIETEKKRLLAKEKRAKKRHLTP